MKNSRKYCYFMFFTIFSFYQLFAGSVCSAGDCQIEGTIHTFDRKPISNATILIAETGLEYQTNELGFFCIRNLKSGIYNLLAIANGYNPQEIPPVHIRNGSSHEQVIEIEMIRGFREEIVVTATRTEKRLSNVP
ncbi:carboxypeptidase-like regulatory domain-containing protein, partial [bacterium]|nr:carboxypeptidase-like regulatory domain-containing protein [bacterium]